MGKKRHKKKRRRRGAEPEISSEQTDEVRRSNMFMFGGVMGLALGAVVAFNLFPTEGPRAIAIGAGIAFTTWFGFWMNYGRKK